METDEYARLRELLLESEKRRLDALENRLDATRRAVASGLRSYQERLQTQAEQVDQIEHERLQTIADHLTAFNNELEQLKNFSQSDAFTQALARALPDAIQQANTEKNLNRALQAPVTQCLQTSVEQDTQMIADALFPVMGPAIRKSINEALKTFLHSINTLLEQGLSPRRQLWWRFQARLKGLSYAEYVLQQTLLYRVEQTFLIHRETGLLLQHISQPNTALTDSDAVSAMLTAIQDFIHDSFSATKTEELNSVEIGEYTVWLERGPRAVLACVIQGNAPRNFRQVMSDVLAEIHRKYPLLLSTFEGETAPFAECHPLLKSTLQAEQRIREDFQAKRLVSLPLLISFGVLLAVAIWLGTTYFLQQQRFQHYLTQLSSTPGLVVTEHKIQAGQLYVRGLRDPLAILPESLIQNAGLEPAQVHTSWRYYQAFDPIIVEQRFRHQANPPATIDIMHNDDELVLTGHAPAAWLEHTKNQSASATGAGLINLDAVQTTESRLLQHAKEVLQPPNSVTLHVEEEVLRIAGEVSETDFDQLTQRLSTLNGFTDIDATKLSDHQARFSKLQQTLENQMVYFTNDTVLAESQLPILTDVGNNIQTLLSLCQEMNIRVKIQLSGMTDGLGTEAFNRTLATARANFAKQWLLDNHDINEEFLQVTVPEKIRHNQTQPNLSLRRVTFSVLQ